MKKQKFAAFSAPSIFDLLLAVLFIGSAFAFYFALNAVPSAPIPENTLKALDAAISETEDEKSAAPTDAGNNAESLRQYAAGFGGAVYYGAVKDLDLNTIDDKDKIETLVCRDENIDLSSLSVFTGIKTLVLENCSVSSLSGLPDFPLLSELDLTGNSITDISSLVKYTSLETLNLTGNNISDTEPLLNLTALKTLYLSGNPVSYDQIKKLSEASMEVSFYSPLPSE